MTGVALAAMFAAVGLGVTAALTTVADAHPTEPTEATEQSRDDLFLTAPNGWQTYVNGRFATRISYPAYLFAAAEAPEAGDGRRFEGEDAIIEVIGWENENGLTPQELASHLIGRQGYDDVFRQEVEEARLVLSGNRTERTFHEEYVFQSDTVQAFAMEYTSALHSTYDPLLEQIAASFRHGEEALTSELAEAPRLGECPADDSCPPPPGSALPPDPPADIHGYGEHRPVQARPPASGELRVLVWAPKGQGGKKLKMKGSRHKELKMSPGKRKSAVRDLGGKKPKVKKPGRKKAKGNRGRGKKR